MRGKKRFFVCFVFLPKLKSKFMKTRNSTDLRSKHESCATCLILVVRSTQRPVAFLIQIDILENRRLRAFNVY